MLNDFSYHRSRSELEHFEYGECSTCRETVIFSVVKANQKRHAFDPKPVGGSEINPSYSIHVCKKEEDE